MRYWSKGLGKRALYIEWSEGKAQITIEGGRERLGSAVPLHLLRGMLPPVEEQVIIAGDTLPPVVWRYISILTKEDFEDILKLAASRETVEFLARSPGGRKLFLKLAWLQAVFFLRYLWAWVVSKVLKLPESPLGESDHPC